MITYEIDGRIAVITGCDANEKEIEIPLTIEDKIVGKIAEYAFSENKSITRITIPKSVKLIGEYAFTSCSNLSEVVFAEGMETIEDWAFASCSIEKIGLPSTIRNIGPNAFLGCGVKKQIDEFMKKKNEGRQINKKAKNNLSVWPSFVMLDPERVTVDDITARAKYHNQQITDMHNGALDFTYIDVPLVFDQSEFVVAINSEKKLPDFRTELSLETQKEIGLYDENDPDFILVTFQLYSDYKDLVGDVTIKTPYLEEVTFDVLEFKEIEDGEGAYRYYVKIRANLGCYGTGNLEREFAMNQYEHLEGRYLTELQYGIITDDEANKIRAEIDEIAMDTLKSFMEQLSGAPMLMMQNRLFEAYLADEEYENKAPVTEYITNKYFEIYNFLGSVESLQEYAFNVDEGLQVLCDAAGADLATLQAKYNIYPSDEEGNPLDKVFIESFKVGFTGNEINYNLHGDFLTYIYETMKNLNEKFLSIAIPGYVSVEQSEEE